MCGLAGLLFKDQEGPTGKLLLAMLAQLNRRGPDSTGLALYGNLSGESTIVCVKVENKEDGQSWKERLIDVARRFGTVLQADSVGKHVRLVMDTPGSYAALARSLEALSSDIEVFSMGRHLEVYKDMGYAHELDAVYGLSSYTGSHAIGHTRLATESRVDISHAHPFWARPFPDISLVHNGQITNYHKLRRRMEIKGHSFKTGNDSELIAVYIADMLQEGATLDEAVRATLTTLDGCFTYLVATAEGIGYARDQFGSKPLIVMETDEVVALASEEVALRQAFPFDFEAREAPAYSIHTWQRNPVTLTARKTTR